MHFVNILVPVNLHLKDDQAAKLAIHIADPRYCVIHLISVVKPGSLLSVFERNKICQEISGIGLRRFVKGMIYLSEIKAMIEMQKPSAIVKTHICRSNHFPRAIVWYANRLAAQVVIIPETENKRRCLFARSVPAEYVAGRTNCKVVTCSQGIFSLYEKRDSFVKYFQYGNGDQVVNTIGNYFAEN